uniref:Uncharacterized protein n=1 Tax=Arundo donax TaxID=35708 RepID=A0A0A8Y870_ARUDO
MISPLHLSVLYRLQFQMISPLHLSVL